MPGEFLQQFSRVIGEVRQDVLTLLVVHNEERPSYHNLSMEDATELALDRRLWRLLAASRAVH